MDTAINTTRNASEIIKNFNASLLKEETGIKYKLMAGDEFRFFRGTCHLFYYDLHQANALLDPPYAWACGDLHIENFGSYKSQNRLVYFDLNDFDESLLAPAAWDIVRMVTSILVAFEALKIERVKALRMAEHFLKTYSKTLAKGKALYIEPRIADGVVKTFLDAACCRKQKDLLQKRTIKKGKKLMLAIDSKRHFKIDKILKEELKDHITNWVKQNDEGPYNFRVLDVAFRVAGTGSVGVRRYVFLLQSLKTSKKYFLLDMKQATPSSVLPFTDVPQPQWPSEADREVNIQERVQNVPPALLSTTIFQGNSFLLKEMQPMEDKIDFNLIISRYRDVYKVIDDMAVLTASAQLRSSGRQGSAIADELIQFAQKKEWQDQVLDYAVQYLSQVKKDYQQYLIDYKQGYFQ